MIDAEQRPGNEHARRFNSPTDGNEVAILMKGEEHGKRDIVLQACDKKLTFISETHRAYHTLQYPILFSRREDGYHITLSQNPNTRQTVTCKQFYSFHFMERFGTFNLLTRCRDLYQQFAVDMYAKIQAERLLYIKLHQKKLRVESYIHLQDQIRGEKDPNQIGKLCILPSSFTGSPRYMHERYQDAMTYVRNFGKPDLFITFTAKPIPNGKSLKKN